MFFSTKNIRSIAWAVMDTPVGPPPSSPELPAPFGDLAGVGDGELEVQICSFASRIAAAMCLFLLAVAEYDRREAWQRWECRSMMHWLSWRCGISPALAGQYCRTAAALAGLPEVTARFSSGELSYSQVRAICRVATPQTEDMLVELARYSTAAQLEKVVSSYQHVKAVAEQTAEERDRRRTLTWGYDDDGSVTGMFRLPPEDAAVFIKAIKERTVSFDPTGPDSDNHALDPIGARQADALVDLAAADLDRAAEQTADPGDRYLVTIITDVTLLTPHPEPDETAVVDIDIIDTDADTDTDTIDVENPVDPTDSTDNVGQADANHHRQPGAPDTDEPDTDATHPDRGYPDRGPAGPDPTEPDPTEPDPTETPRRQQPAPATNPLLCEVAGGPGLAPSTVQRLLCDQPYVPITTDGDGNILDVGRRTRRINRGLRRALNHRDQHCRFPGCTATIVDAHHLDYWTHGGPTRLTNLASLCRRHHRRQHQGGFQISHGPGDELTFILPNGQHLTTTPPAPTPAAPGGDLRPATPTSTEWDGTGLTQYTLDVIITGLLQADGLLTDDQPPDERVIEPEAFRHAGDSDPAPSTRRDPEKPNESAD
jgi:Domain of unknown function (DUF222)